MICSALVTLSCCQPDIANGEVSAVKNLAFDHDAGESLASKRKAGWRTIEFTFDPERMRIEQQC